MSPLWFQYALDLEERVAMAETMKERFYKQEEQNDETLGLATQEAAKVKHLVSYTATLFCCFKQRLFWSLCRHQGDIMFLPMFVCLSVC